MPACLIHDKYASKLGISKSLSREINIEIDSIDDMKFHDYGRFISSGRWDNRITMTDAIERVNRLIHLQKPQKALYMSFGLSKKEEILSPSTETTKEFLTEFHGKKIREPRIWKDLLL